VQITTNRMWTYSESFVQAQSDVAEYVS